MNGSTVDWALLFFIYCVIGWIWESCFVSISRHAWVNRGFLYGPWLPIYGTGALLILLVTRPVRASAPLVFLLGMASATALEYVIGAAMERLFHMRYWDYSKRPFNLDGYICLRSSLGWGLFSVLLVRFVNPPIQRLVASVPALMAEPLALALVALFTVDTVKSVQAALDLKALLASITEHSQVLAAIEARVAEAAGQLEHGSESFMQKVREWEGVLAQEPERLLEQAQTKLQSRAEAFAQRLSRQREEDLRRISEQERKLSLLMEEIGRQSRAPRERERWDRVSSSLEPFRAALQRVKSESQARSSSDYRRGVSLLERNPGTVSGRYRDALSHISRLKSGSRSEKGEGQG